MKNLEKLFIVKQALFAPGGAKTMAQALLGVTAAGGIGGLGAAALSGNDKSGWAAGGAGAGPGALAGGLLGSAGGFGLSALISLLTRGKAGRANRSLEGVLGSIGGLGGMAAGGAYTGGKWHDTFKDGYDPQHIPLLRWIHQLTQSEEGTGQPSDENATDADENATNADPYNYNENPYGG